jgi:hypothetical protein
LVDDLQASPTSPTAPIAPIARGTDLRKKSLLDLLVFFPFQQKLI